MAPKVKISKEDIINASVDIVRNSGAEALNSRTIAKALNCSTQPIFSNFDSMESLCIEVVRKANSLYQEYVRKETESNNYPIYKSGGMAYIRFAKDEKELFKLLYMRDRANESDDEQAIDYDKMVEIVQKNTGLDIDSAKLFHLEMWAFVHGIATMFVTGFVGLDWELVSNMLSDSYLGLRKQFGLD